MSSLDTRDARAARRARRDQSSAQNTLGPSRLHSDAMPRSLGEQDTQNANDEEVSEDDTCPICRLLLHEPVTTTCNHTLCKFCMAQWASVSLAAPMTIVDVDEEPVEFDAVSELEARCPMCRTMTTATANPALAQELKSRYPLTHGEREAEAHAEADGLGGDAIHTITVYIGNRHTRIPPSPGSPHNIHDWTFFVRPSRTDIVEEVHIFLHPTFRQNRVVRQRPPYQISRVGWGIFTITASVVLKAGYSWVSDDAQDSPDGAVKGVLPLEWMLDFDGFGGKGSMGRCRLKVKNDRDWDGVSEEEERDQREWGRMIRQYERDGRYEP
ncbi:hypothetical protein PFICI_11543 [Pestalotiopsis fici W106-1]|uniref:Protein AF-9 homolog n=1 Tax=Pestalotiopsis fici (strain W106-1 / CGMCC3.15140) TaxID=1229662 RepID=W3WTJ5_PESFW|nr:uncharacterized protein PFICI_11543 [Pestalotiopsis fici W106-1]ETS76156.1 hypothetical protein PFICI_11543 [Pestalotiopsis fici W106-1]